MKGYKGNLSKMPDAAYISSSVFVTLVPPLRRGTKNQKNIYYTY